MTEHTKRYKYVNSYVSLLYTNLPTALAKLSHLLFTLVIKNVIYSDKGNTKPGEDRIYTNTPMTIYSVLENVKSISYAEGKKMSNDRSNWEKKLQELYDNNVFYFWKYNGFYIFILEREFASWRMYNKNGYVTPRTMIKIIIRADEIINTMEGFVRKEGSEIDRLAIENSFGVFINKMLDKMNPVISLSKWNGEGSIYDYLEEVFEPLKSLSVFDGLVESEEFLIRLPPIVREKYKKLIEKWNAMSEKEQRALAEELSPKGDKANLGKKIRKKRQKKIVTPEGNSVPKTPVKKKYDKKIEPFEDSKQFVKYYKAFLQQYSGTTSICFDDFESDAGVAAEILDLLAIHGRKNKEFLDTWLKYFFDHDLKGLKMYKAEHTAMRTFRYSFEKFKDAYFVPA